MARRSEARKLRSLPGSADEYWQDAHVELINVKGRPSRQRDCEHYFEKDGNRIECKNCGVGFFIKSDDEVRDGHLYKDNRLII